MILNIGPVPAEALAQLPTGQFTFLMSSAPDRKHQHLFIFRLLRLYNSNLAFQAGMQQRQKETEENRCA